MIPKKIHWCWVGRGKTSDMVEKCVASWRHFLPDYEIKLWNEDNFDINCCRYVKEAYSTRKWAFVADYVRLYALYTEGGIYMDSDVEVIQNLDKFLDNTAFTGYENFGMCLTGIMGSVKGGQFVKDLLDEYKDRRFIMDDGRQNWTTNITYTNNMLQSKGINIFQNELIVDNYVRIYPVDFFCPNPKNPSTITDNTHTIHHFCGSWLKG